jgi:hypothetical protein
MALLSTVTDVCQWLTQLASMLDPRSAPRFANLLRGSILARGKRTVTRWIRASELAEEFRECYTTIAAAGKRTADIAAQLLCWVVKPLLIKTPRIVFAIDDTPTERVGPSVQGRGIHHNPTPGPAGSQYLSGHIWVTLAIVLSHPFWGVIALPLRAMLYIRKLDLNSIDEPHRPEFQTKLEMAVDLMKWACSWLKSWGKAIWVVADGAYAKKPLLQAMIELGVTVVSRLPHNAALYAPPEPRKKGQRGRPRKKGKERISLAKRAAAKDGWMTETFTLYGKCIEKKYKTFVAYWGPAGAVIRVILVMEDNHSWRAYFCTDVDASVKDILETVADRFAIETMFRDVKEIVGAGEQQKRCHFANIGCFHVCLWTYTVTEAWGWNRKASELTAHRADSPWDDESRRPSHADKRNALRRELLRKDLERVLGTRLTRTKIGKLAESLLQLAA